MHKWEAKLSSAGELEQCAHCGVVKRKANADAACKKRISELSEKLLASRANGDPQKYMAFVSVAEAHEIGALLLRLPS